VEAHALRRSRAGPGGGALRGPVVRQHRGSRRRRDAVHAITRRGAQASPPVDPSKKDAILAALREVVTARPVAPPQRPRFTAEELEKLRREREERQRKRELEERKAAKPSVPK